MKKLVLITLALLLVGCLGETDTGLSQGEVTQLTQAELESRDSLLVSLQEQLDALQLRNDSLLAASADSSASVQEQLLANQRALDSVSVALDSLAADTTGGEPTVVYSNQQTYNFTGSVMSNLSTLGPNAVWIIGLTGWIDDWSPLYESRNTLKGLDIGRQGLDTLINVEYDSLPVFTQLEMLSLFYNDVNDSDLVAMQGTQLKCLTIIQFRGLVTYSGLPEVLADSSLAILYRGAAPAIPDSIMNILTAKGVELVTDDGFATCR